MSPTDIAELGPVGFAVIEFPEGQQHFSAEPALAEEDVIPPGRPAVVGRDADSGRSRS